MVWRLCLQRDSQLEEVQDQEGLMVFYQLLIRGSVLPVLGGDIPKFLLEKKKRLEKT